jgi:hypothetical protein
MRSLKPVQPGQVLRSVQPSASRTPRLPGWRRWRLVGRGREWTIGHRRIFGGGGLDGPL